MPELVCAAGAAGWLDVRRTGVTATDIVTICGLSRYDSAYSLYWRKRGELPEPGDNDRFRLGRELEPYVWQRWVDAADDHDEHSYPAGLWRSSARPWQLATPDATMATGDMRGVVEVKTWADADKTAWGDPGGAQIPPAVRAQVLWQMDVMDVAAGHVGVLFLPSGEFRHYIITHVFQAAARDEHGWCPLADKCSICADLAIMREAGHEFYRRMTGELGPPDVDGSVATLAALKGRYPDARKGKTVPIPAELWDEFVWRRGLADEQTKLAHMAEAQMRELTGEAADIEVDGVVVGRRIIGVSHIKAHDRHSDYIKRVGSKNDVE